MEITTSFNWENLSIPNKNIIFASLKVEQINNIGGLRLWYTI